MTVVKEEPDADDVAESQFVQGVIQWFTETMGLKNSDIAQALDVTDPTVSKWKRGEGTNLSTENYRKVVQLQQLRSLMERTFPDDPTRKSWLRSDIKDDVILEDLGPLHGMPPRGLLIEGNIEPIVQYLASVDSAAYL